MSDSMVNPGSTSALGRSTLSLIVFGFLGVGLNTLFGMALANTMPATEFGEFAAARGMLNLTTIVATLGFVGLIMSALPKAIEEGALPLARGLLHFAPRAVVLAGFLIAAAACAFHFYVEGHTILEFEHFMLVMVLLPLAGLQAYWAATASALDAAVQASAVTRVIFPLVALFLVGLMYLWQGDELDMPDGALIWGIAIIVGSLLTARVLHRAKIEPLRAGPRVGAGAQWLRAAAPYLTATALLVWLDIGGIIVIGWIHADSESTAMFTAAAELSTLALVLGLTTTTLFQPRLAAAIHAGNLALVKRIERDRNRIVIPFTLVTGTVLIVFSRDFLELYGEEYVDAQFALVVLVLAKSLNSIFALALPELQYMGSKLAIWILAFFCAVSLAAMVTLGHAYDESGIALGLGVSLALASVTLQITLWISRRKRLAPDASPDAATRA